MIGRRSSKELDRIQGTWLAPEPSERPGLAISDFSPKRIRTQSSLGGRRFAQALDRMRQRLQSVEAVDRLCELSEMGVESEHILLRMFRETDWRGLHET
jgi:hypothetical protein